MPPTVIVDRAAVIFADGPLPSPSMSFVHRVTPAWRDRIPAAVHVDGTARIQTVDPATQPRLGRTIERFEALTGLPVDLLVMGPHLVRRTGLFGEAGA